VSTGHDPTLGSGKPAPTLPVSGPAGLGHKPHRLLGLRGFPGWHPGSPGGWLARSLSVAGRVGQENYPPQPIACVPYRELAFERVMR